MHLRRIMVTTAVALILTSCTSQAVPTTTTVNLRADQESVDNLQQQVAQDQQAYQASNVQSEATYSATACAQNANACPAPSASVIAKLRADELKLQVAQDKLKRDENSG